MVQASTVLNILASTTVISGVLANGILAGQGVTQTVEPIQINFQAQVGDDPFQCDGVYRLGTMNNAIAVTDFRLYVSDAQLIRADGERVPIQLEQDGIWQFQNVALLDFEDQTGSCTNGTSAMRTHISGTVPSGDYSGIEFTLGVPFDLNHNDVTLAPSPLNLTSMWWNWQGGYKFVRIDLENQMESAGLQQYVAHTGHSDGHGEGSEHHNHPAGEHMGHASGFLIHLGSTGCQVEGNAQQPTFCSNPNTSTVAFDNFDPRENVIVADLSALVADSNLMMNAPDTPLGCMSSPADSDCAEIFENFGLSHGTQPTTTQTFFRAE